MGEHRPIVSIHGFGRGIRDPQTERLNFSMVSTTWIVDALTKTNKS